MKKQTIMTGLHTECMHLVGVQQVAVQSKKYEKVGLNTNQAEESWS